MLPTGVAVEGEEVCHSLKFNILDVRARTRHHIVRGCSLDVFSNNFKVTGSWVNVGDDFCVNTCNKV